jgi:4-amino-4-deoxy-L-arabinose transferase-like glycosyltransferase
MWRTVAAFVGPVSMWPVRWSFAWLAAVTLLAAALRWFRIDAQSLWYDEGISAHQLTRSFGEILRATALDTHPPLYYWTLKAWAETVGASELGLRSLSAVCGVLSVVLTWLLGRRLFGPLVATLAAVLLAVAPLAVYYSQEVRMYAQVTTLGLLAVFAYAATLRRTVPGKNSAKTGWYMLYTLAAVATLYTQYLGAAFLIAVNLHSLFWWQQRGGKDWLRWFAANAAAAVVFVPWLPTFIDQQTHALNVSPRTPSGLMLQTLDAYGGGLAQGDVFVWTGSALLGLAVVGLLGAAAARFTTHGVTQAVTRGSNNVTWESNNVTWESNNVTWESNNVTWDGKSVTPAGENVTPGGVAVLNGPQRSNAQPPQPRCAHTQPLQTASLALLIWLLPLALVLYLGLRSGLFEVRYLVLGMPGLCLLAAVGIMDLTRVPALSVLATAALLFPAAQGLSQQYFDPALARDDYRGLVQAIAAQAQPTDAIVLAAPNQVEVFNYYYHGPLPVIGLPAQRPIDAADTQARLAQLKQTYGRIWLVQWAINEADPPGVILTWLAQNGFQASHTWYGSLQLALIGFGAANAPLHQVNLALDNGITLEAYQLPSDTLRAGETLQLTLVWRAGDGPTQDRWKVFTHILDQNSQVVAQRDAEPDDTLRPTTTWTTKEQIKDNYGIALPPDLAPGDYTLEIGMYNGDTRATFAGQGNHLELGVLHVRR